MKNDLPVYTPVVVVGQNGLKDGSRVRVTEVRRYAWQTDFPEEEAQNIKQLSRRPSEMSQKGDGRQSRRPVKRSGN